MSSVPNMRVYLLSDRFQTKSLLKEKGISATVLDMYCVKPLDTEGIIKAANGVKAVITVEEHSPFGGPGSRNC